MIDAFEEYVSAYDLEDPKIRLKRDHSLRVADLCRRIAACAEGADPDLAWVIGLLHDIGRFEQVRRYHTFVDADSVDHARLGADLLLHEGLLDELEAASGQRQEAGPKQLLAGPEGQTELEPELPLSQPQRRLLETTIRWHSSYRLPEGLTGQETLYCQILRDADKIDIFRVLCDTPPEEIYDVSAEDLRSAGVTEAVRQCFLNGTAVLREKRKTPIDKIVGHICLTFELVYPISRQIARDQGYVDRLLDFRSENEDTAHWFAYMRDHIWE